MSGVLLMRFNGPMQAWGTQSRFTIRDTGREPSKSGVIGLLCCALGRHRDEPVDDLAALWMGVRVDREGVMARDFHTALDVVKASGAKGKDAVISTRYYLADANFLVGLEGNPALLNNIQKALASPVWPPYLGRKSFVPATPVYIPRGLLEKAELEQSLKNFPIRLRKGKEPEKVRAIIETDDEEAEVRNDLPISFDDRLFTLRRVKTMYWETSEIPKEENLCISQD